MRQVFGLWVSLLAEMRLKLKEGTQYISEGQGFWEGDSANVSGLSTGAIR